VLENNAIKYIFTDEGRATYDGSLFHYEYNLKDHLGNVCVTFNEAGVVQQEDSYYPFGLTIKGLHYPVSGNLANKFLYNGKELQDEFGFAMYDYGFRFYDPVIGRWWAVDPLSEKYYSLSNYAYCANNPIRLYDVDGRYFDDDNEKKAGRIERRAEKKAARLERKADKIDKRGGNSGDLRARVGELRQSAQDVRDMRNDKSTEYKYEKLDSKEAKTLGVAGPSSAFTGQNSKGDNVVTMFTENNMGNKIHETRHGGQNARGEFNIVTGAKYGVADEVSAYRSQYSWDGSLKFIDVNKNPTQAEILNSLQTGSNPLMNTINSINLINANFVNSLVDPGFVPIYPPTGIPLNIWNSN